MNQTRVKICGITNYEDAKVATEAGADLLGFIFYPKSSRYVAPTEVAGIIQQLRALQRDNGVTVKQPKYVGVFVNTPPAEVAETLDQVGLDLAQLYSNEGPEQLAQLQGRVFMGLRPQNQVEAEFEAGRFAHLGPIDGPCLLVDAYDPNFYGGTGEKGDWQSTATLARRYPGLLLAGGLRWENVAEAIRVVQPWGVDVASGTEASPGVKDHEKVRRFVENVKGVV